jgi:biopolymer transport protein ExbB
MCKKLGLLGFLVLWGSSVAWAEEGESQTQSMLSVILQNAGLCGWLTLLLSVAGTVVIFSCYFELRREKLIPEALAVELTGLIEGKQYQKALQLCATELSFLAKVMGAGLGKISLGLPAMQKAMQEVGEEQALRMHQTVGWLNFISNVATMLGLLGTVQGMIVSFGTIKAMSSPSPADLAGGIEGALVTTLIGLVVAIPMLAAYFYFRNLVDRLVIEAGLVVEELLARIPRKNPS